MEKPILRLIVNFSIKIWDHLYIYINATHRYKSKKYDMEGSVLEFQCSNPFKIYVLLDFFSNFPLIFLQQLWFHEPITWMVGLFIIYFYGE